MHPIFEKRQTLEEWRRKPTLEIMLRVEKKCGGTWLTRWGSFLENPGNFSGPQLYFKVKIYGMLNIVDKMIMQHWVNY